MGTTYARLLSSELILHVVRAQLQAISPVYHSQEEELLLEGCVERADVVRDALRVVLGVKVGQVAGLLRETDACEEISDLVCIHARSWHLDGASPVEVVVAQGEDELLQLKL